MPQKDPDAHREYNRRWREANPEKVREQNRRADAKRRAKGRASKDDAAKRRAKYEAVIAWRRANPEKFRAQRRRANAVYFAKDPERKRAASRRAAKKARDLRYMALAEQAIEPVIRRPDDLNSIADPLYDDALATALLSLWENRWRRNRHYSEDDWVNDARDAARAVVRAERAWHHKTVPIGDWFDVASPPEPL